MKTKILQRSIPVLGMIVFFAVAGMTPSRAHDSYYYDRDHDGYWDGYHRFHHRVYYHDHYGYWDDRNGARIFVNVGL